MKFEKNTEAYKLTKSAIAEDLDEATTEAAFGSTALAAYRALKLRDYGRIDMRLAPNGDVYVIEANPNPWLASRQEFAMAAKASGLSYTEMIGTIVDLAMSRYLNANWRCGGNALAEAVLFRDLPQSATLLQILTSFGMTLLKMPIFENDGLPGRSFSHWRQSFETSSARRRASCTLSQMFSGPTNSSNSVY